MAASYNEGSFVSIGGNLYIVTDDIEAAWIEESIGFQTISVDTFSDADTYVSGAIVEKESTYYRCIAESSVGTWEDTSSNFEQLSVSGVVEATEYINGDYVTNSGVLYQCVAEAGASGSNLLHYCSATAYDVTSSYSQNSYVLNNGGLYFCAVAEEISALSASLTVISEFSDESPYAVDDIVLHDNKIYRCIQVHEAGEWSDEDFDLEVEVTDLFDSYTINQTVNGVAGAGGLIGWYRPSFSGGSVKVDISKYNLQSSDAIAKLKATSASGDVGGLFGVLCNATAVNEGSLTGAGGEIQIVGNIDNSLKSTNQGKTGNYGGIIGKYKTSALTSSLKIENVAASPSNDGGSDYYGGLIGKIDGAAYAELTNVSATNVDKLSGIFGGAVSSADEAFVKVKDIKVSIKESATFTGGGVIGHLTSGVLELAGKTDLSDAKPRAAADNGQIVGERDSALVFADAGWDVLRCGAVTVDDIGTWGNVVRFNDVSTQGNNELFEQSDVFTIDTTAHTVTLNDVSISDSSTSISSAAEYAIFALNNQIRTESSVLKVGATVAADNAILESINITFGASVDLTGTGMTGLTRDALIKDSDGKLTEKYLDYSGIVTGRTGISVKLAIGESFGKRSNWNTNASGEGCGQIYRHS